MQSRVVTRFNLPRHRLLALATIAVYGSQLLMAGYALCAADCADRKGAVWKLAAGAIGAWFLLSAIRA